jgi:hypothetical protein
MRRSKRQAADAANGEHEQQSSDTWHKNAPKPT